MVHQYEVMYFSDRLSNSGQYFSKEILFQGSSVPKPCIKYVVPIQYVLSKMLNISRKFPTRSRKSSFIGIPTFEMYFYLYNGAFAKSIIFKMLYY